jgi:hypothetical protein
MAFTHTLVLQEEKYWTNMAAVLHAKDVCPTIQTEEKDSERTAALTG